MSMQCMDNCHHWRPESSDILGSPETGWLQMVVSHSVGAGNQTWCPLWEQQVLLSPEPSLYPLFLFLFTCACGWGSEYTQVSTEARTGCLSDVLELELLSRLWAVWCRCWELNPGPLKEQPVLLTNDSSPHPELWSLYVEPVPNLFRPHLATWQPLF